MATRKRFHRTVYPLKDQDYVSRLSAEERAYLDKFNEEYYGASFTSDPLHTDEAQRRELFRTKNHRNEDIYGRSLDTGDLGLDRVAATPLEPAAPGAEYLETEEYREALEEFRGLLSNEDRRKNPSLTPEFSVARAKLRAATGASTSTGDKGAYQFMPKSRVERLQSSRQIVWNLGVTVAHHQFPGHQAPMAAEMIQWVEGVLAGIERKLGAMGVELKPLGVVQGPEAKDG